MPEPAPPGVEMPEGSLKTENGSSAGNTGSQNGPPTLPPIDTSASDGTLLPLSPATAGGTVRRAAPEPNKRALYVGGLDQRVTEDILTQIFATAGHVLNVKIIPDKNSRGFNYGFVEYDDPSSAQRAMDTLNGRRIHNSEIRVNWAYQATSATKEDTTSHSHIFVGDLSNEVNDEVLLQAFAAFGDVSEARVMWDMKTGRSRGYGFVAFRDKNDAEKALSAMDGEWLGSRAIRCNWANQKGQPSMSQQQAMAQLGMTTSPPYTHHQFPTQGAQSYEMVAAQTPPYQTTCYVGNLTPYTTQNDLVPLFHNFGFVVEARFQSDRGFAFIKMDTHENAAMAICQLNGYNVNGRPLKCSWGKERAATGSFEAFSPQGPGPQGGFGQSPAAYFPQYGSPGQAMSPQATHSAGGHFAGGSPGGYGQQFAMSPSHFGGGYGGRQQQGAPPQNFQYQYGGGQ